MYYRLWSKKALVNEKKLIFTPRIPHFVFDWNRIWDYSTVSRRQITYTTLRFDNQCVKRNT